MTWWKGKVLLHSGHKYTSVLESLGGVYTHERDILPVIGLFVGICEQGDGLQVGSQRIGGRGIIFGRKGLIVGKFGDSVEYSIHVFTATDSLRTGISPEQVTQTRTAQNIGRQL
jgi:hypothetical protein